MRKEYSAPKWPRVQVSPQLHKKLQKAADKAGVSMTEFADKALQKVVNK